MALSDRVGSRFVDASCESLRRGWSQTCPALPLPPNAAPHRSAEVRALSLHVHGIDRLTRGHEQPVSFGSSKADVGTDLRQEDHSDARAVGGEDMDPVVAVADPAGGRPDVPIGVGANAIGAAIATDGSFLTGADFDRFLSQAHVDE